MKTTLQTREVTVVRLYLTEAEAHLDKLLARLHDEEKVAGVTVFRGISGFGKSGEMHSARLLDMAMNLPVVVEFFDQTDKVESILEHLNEIIEPGHMLIWPAKVNV